MDLLLSKGFCHADEVGKNPEESYFLDVLISLSSPLVWNQKQETKQEAALLFWGFSLVKCDCGFRNSLASTAVPEQMTERINPFLFLIFTPGLCCLPQQA